MAVLFTIYKPSNGPEVKHNSQTGLSASIKGTLVFKRYPFSRISFFDYQPLIQWICFGRCLMTDMLAADDGCSVRHEETKRLQLSVSKQWAGFCFSKVKEQSEKGDLHVPERTRRNEKSDGANLSDGRTLGIGVVRSGRAPLLEETLVGCSPYALRDPREKGSEDKSERGSDGPPSVCSKPPYENDCVQDFCRGQI
ncbi:hypothetical protein NQZ68_022619 [Dissostichus eleginoides]|nr:hypothetical protein NQZ68_022619 [Dissostichus eleginoides]